MINKEHSKVFDNSILAFLAPSGTSGTVLAGLLDTAGIARRAGNKSKEVTVGSCVALHL